MNIKMNIKMAVHSNILNNLDDSICTLILCFQNCSPFGIPKFPIIRKAESGSMQTLYFGEDRLDLEG